MTTFNVEDIWNLVEEDNKSLIAFIHVRGNGEYHICRICEKPVFGVMRDGKTGKTGRPSRNNVFVHHLDKEHQDVVAYCALIGVIPYSKHEVFCIDEEILELRFLKKGVIR